MGQPKVKSWSTSRRRHGATSTAIASGKVLACELGPFVDGETRVVKELKHEGVIKALYRRVAGPGVLPILEGESIDAIRERVDTLPFVIEKLMTLECEEIYEI